MRFLDDASNARDRRVRVISELFTSACYTFEHKWQCTALDPYLWFSTSHRKWNREIQHSVYCRSPHPDQQQGWVPIPCVWRQLRVGFFIFRRTASPQNFISSERPVFGCKVIVASLSL